MRLKFYAPVMDGWKILSDFSDQIPSSFERAASCLAAAPEIKPTVSPCNTGLPDRAGNAARSGTRGEVCSRSPTRDDQPRGNRTLGKEDIG